ARGPRPSRSRPRSRSRPPGRTRARRSPAGRPARAPPRRRCTPWPPRGSRSLRTAPPSGRRARGTPPPGPSCASPARRPTTRKTSKGSCRKARPSPRPSRPRGRPPAPSPQVWLAQPTSPPLLRCSLDRRLVTLEQPRHRRGKLRALAAPESEAVGCEAQRLAALGGLRVVKTYALDEALVRGLVRIGDHDVEKRPLLGPAAGQSNHHHVGNSASRKGRDFTRLRL